MQELAQDSRTDRRGILFIGRESEYKGIAVLDRGWEKLPISVRNAHPLHLLVSGPGNKVSVPSENIWVSRGVYSDRDAIQALLRAAVVVLPYTEASQSGVQVLAMQCGTPAVVSNVGALPEFSPDEDLVFPSGDDNALAGALLRALNPDGWDIRHQSALARFRTRHSVEQLRAEVSQLIGEACASS